MEGVLSLNSKHFWAQRAIKVIIALLALIILPFYIYFGIQPAASLDVSSYPTLEIARLGLSTPVAPVELQDHQLTVPDSIAGIYQQQPHKKLIIGHSSTVFRKLAAINVGDTLVYDGRNYHVTEISTLKKSEIDMGDVLATTNEETIVIMTCAGKALPAQDATHRLLVTAVIDEAF